MTILINNLRRIFGKPINIILMIVVPLVLNIFFISVSSGSQKYTIRVIDYDDSKLTQLILAELEDEAEIVDIEDDEDAIKAALINSEISLALKIEEGYAEKIINGEDAKFQTFAITENNKSEPIRLLIESLTTSARELGRQSKGDSDKFYKAMDAYAEGALLTEYETFEFTKQETVNRTVTSLGYLAMGMMFLMTFATTLLLEDRKFGVFSRIATTPVSRASYLVQHLFSYIVVAVIQIVLIFNIIPQMVDISYGSTAKIKSSVTLVTLVFAGVCIAIGITISRFAKNSNMVSALLSLINLPVLMLGGCLWPREIMPDAVQRIGDFVPTTWFLEAAKGALHGEGLGSVAKDLALMVGLIAVLLTLSFVIKTDDK